MSSDTDSCYSLKLAFECFCLNPHLRCFVILSVLGGGDRADRQKEEEVQTGRQRQDKLRQERCKERCEMNCHYCDIQECEYWEEYN